MRKILSALLLVGVVHGAGLHGVVPTLSSSAAAAETSEKELMDQIKKVKAMVADLEMQLKSKKMMMDAMKRDEAMKMLSDVENLLRKIQAP